MMRKTEFAFWTFLLMTGLAAATTLLNVTRSFSATSSNSELYRQLDLFARLKGDADTLRFRRRGRCVARRLHHFAQIAHFRRLALASRYVYQILQQFLDAGDAGIG